MGSEHCRGIAVALPQPPVGSAKVWGTGAGESEESVRLLIQITLVAFGSALGGLARWGIGSAAGRLFGTAFPFGTLFINVVGSFFLGWFMTVFTDRLTLTEGSWIRPDDLRLMVAVGFTGAFTTFSTFEYETHGLLRDGDSLLASGYLIGSVVLGLVAVRAGVLLARWL